MYLTKRDYGLEKYKQPVWSAALLGVSKRAVCLQISDSVKDSGQKNSVYRTVLKVCIE
jgi:hypothetical protein